MQILITEDETYAAERLERQILKLLPEARITGKTKSIKETVQWLQNNTPDLIFMDIQLSDGISFSIFEEIPVSTPVIFTTAYDQYAIKAFEINSIAYLLKPIKASELEKAVNKYKNLTISNPSDIQKILSQLKEPAEYKESFLIQTGDKFRQVKAEEAAYFYAMEKSVFLKTFGNKNLPTDYTLDKLEQILNPKQFFRVNRKYIVNSEAIEQMRAWSRSRIKLKLKPPADDPKDIVVSIERVHDFKAFMDR
jgi:DNA-binding LytR/AlgR family response regulator